MLNYIIRRLFIGLITLWLITFVVYGLIRAMPGTPVDNQMAMLDPSKEISQADRERMEKLYGLDKPWYVAYFVWIGNVARGDLGNSIPRHQTVATLIAQRIGPTLMLSGTSLFLSYLLAVPMGLFATAKSGTLSEQVPSVGLYMLYSLPSYVGALYLQLLFGVILADSWIGMPLQGMASNNYDQMSIFGKTADLMWHMILPTTCFTYGSLAYFSRFVKSNMEEVVRQDYIRTARAKGVHPFRVIVHHAFRNTMIPMVTMVGLTLPSLLSGAIILERIFAWPGMGGLFFESLQQRDYEVIMGLTLMFSVMTLAGQLLADVLYAVVDPRVQLD
ncbi:MAG: ABC transporter permease [Pirellulaceae bacterium]